MAGPKRPLQAVDANSNPLTSFAEGPINRLQIPAAGVWHAIPVTSLSVRLHVLPSRAGLLYSTSAAAALSDGDPVDADTIATSAPLAAGGTYTLTFVGIGPHEVFVARDPDAPDQASAPVLCIVQSAAA